MEEFGVKKAHRMLWNIVKDTRVRKDSEEDKKAEEGVEQGEKELIEI